MSAGYSFAAFIKPRCVPPVPRLFRAFIMKRCGILLAFSALTQMIVPLLSLHVIHVCLARTVHAKGLWKEPWAKQ